MATLSDDGDKFIIVLGTAVCIDYLRGHLNIKSVIVKI